MNLQYLNKLEDLVDNMASVEKFKQLYIEYFNVEPANSLVTNYLTQCSQKDAYDNYEEDSYESSYDDEEDSYDD